MKDKEGLIAFIKNKSTFHDEQKEEILSYLDVSINGVHFEAQEGASQEQVMEYLRVQMLNSPMFIQTDPNGVSCAVEGDMVAVYSSDIPLSLKGDLAPMTIQGMSDQTWTNDLDAFFPEPLQPFSF
jgi:hypothetical protein